MIFLELLQTDSSTLLISTIVLGLLVGSFLNVVIYRLPIMMQREWRQQCYEFLELDPHETGKEEPIDQHQVFNLVKPDSHCPQCHAPVRAWQNIPVISWLLLRGRCATCHTPISVRYPVIEIVTSVVSGLVAYQFGATWLMLAVLVFSWSLIAMTVIDIDHHLLPDSITIPLLWLGLLVNAFGLNAQISLHDAVIGASAGYLILWTLYWGFKLLTGKEGMGYGDFKLLAALGAWMGWQSLLLIIILSSVVGALTGILLLLRGRDRNTPIPFGPYLAGAGFLTMLWGEPLIQLYFSMMAR